MVRTRTQGGETATLRNLANAARPTNTNSTLLQLRLLQALEKSKENIHIELSQTDDAE